MKNLLVSSLLSLVLTACMQTVAWAAPPDREPVPAATQTPAGMPLSAVIQHLESGTGNRVIGAWQSVGRDGLPVYRIKVLTKSGVLRQIQVDPQTGQQK